MNVRYFEKRPGAWHLDFRLPGGKRVRPYGGPTEAQAKAAAPAVIQAALLGAAQAPAEPDSAPGPTLEQGYRLALRMRPAWARAKAKGSLETTYRAITASVAPSAPLASLNRERVRRLVAEWMREEGKRAGTTLSASTINHRLSFLSVLLEVADLQPHGVKHLSVRGNRRTRRITDAEYNALLDWCAANATRLGAVALSKLIQLAWHTAARQGELLALTWSDVGAEAMRLRDTKNGDDRHVPLNETAAAVLESRRHLTAPFADLNADRVTALWNDARFAMGLASDEEFVFHSIRHEWASRAVERGVNPFVIQAFMGHSNITTTQVYVKVNLKALQEASIVNRPTTAKDAQ